MLDEAFTAHILENFQSLMSSYLKDLIELSPITLPGPGETYTRCGYRLYPLQQ